MINYLLLFLASPAIRIQPEKLFLALFIADSLLWPGAGTTHQAGHCARGSGLLDSPVASSSTAGGLLDLHPVASAAASSSVGLPHGLGRHGRIPRSKYKYNLTNLCFLWRCLKHRKFTLLHYNYNPWQHNCHRFDLGFYKRKF